MVSGPVPAAEVYSMTSTCLHGFETLIRLEMLRQRVLLCSQENRILGISRAYRKENEMQDTDGMWAAREIWIAILELSI